MKIAKFKNESFGSLTTICNEKTGKVMFIAKEVGAMWGHTNMRQVINRLLDEKEYLLVKKSEYPKFFEPFVRNKTLQSKAQRIQLISESGLYKLALASNLEKAKPFRDWVTKEVLPSIRENGYYSFADQTKNIMIHTKVENQKQNSKEINTTNYISGGVSKIIEYNKESCLLHTGKTPSQIKEEGKRLGLKSSQCSSAKEVLRHTDKGVACAMSFSDCLVKEGFDLKTVSELSMKSALPLFEGMMKLGILPDELSK